MHIHTNIMLQQKIHTQSNCSNTKLKTWFRGHLCYLVGKQIRPVLHILGPISANQPKEWHC